MEENKKKLKTIYSLLLGTYKGIKESENSWVGESVANQYNTLLEKLEQLLEDEWFHFYRMENSDKSGGNAYYKDAMIFKLLPIIQYLEEMYMNSKEEEIRKIGSLYNSITDTELQKRCGDILSSEGAFDRVINQATQILEDRIKNKAGLQDSVLIGLALVSKAIHSKLDQTILKFSDKDTEQEDWSLLFKGIIGVYRNPTHHGLDYECTREEALKVCAYIDTLLQAVEKSEKII